MRLFGHIRGLEERLGGGRAEDARLELTGVLGGSGGFVKPSLRLYSDDRPKK